MAGIPLSALLALQVIIVAAAFTAAITVLSEQQRSEFKNALDKQLSLQRASALNAVTSPLLQRKELFKTYVKQYLNGQNNNKQFFAPSDEVGTTENFSHVMEFYKHFYILPVTDPIIQIITFSNESAHVYPAYLAGGAKNKTAISGPGAPQHIIWNIWVADAMKVAYVKNEILVACISPYPADPATCPMFSQYLDTVTTMAHPVEYSRPMMWGVPGLVPDPGVPGTYSKILSFAMTVDTSARPYSMLGVSFSLNHVKPLIYATVATTSSKTAVYTNFYRYQYGWKEYMLITGKTDFDDFNVQAYLAAGEDMYYASWRGGKTPDNVLNAVFFEAQHMFQNQTASGTFELKHDGKDYFVSVARVLDHESGLDWLLTEYTPREEFFGASDRARLTGVLIGVLGALVVLVTCILIWLAIRVPLRSLHAGIVTLPSTPLP